LREQKTSTCLFFFFFFLGTDVEAANNALRIEAFRPCDIMYVKPVTKQRF